MKIFIWVAGFVISQGCTAHANLGNEIITDVLNPFVVHQTSNVVYSLGDKAVQKILGSFGPNTNALRNGDVRVLQGGQWQQANSITDLVDKTYLVRAPAGESTQPKTLKREKMVLNEKIVQAGTAGNLALEAVRSPMPWSPADHAYSTDVRIGLEAEGRRTPKLDAPITINLTGNNADVKPTTLTISKLGQAGFVLTRISCERHDVNAKVMLNSDLGNRSFDIPIGPRTGGLKISTSENRIFGYGLGTAVLIVKRMAEDGREFSDSNALAVSLSVDHGKLDSSSVTIPAGQSRCEVKLRSVGLGETKVSAEGDSYNDELPNVQFVFPISYLIAAIVGGCLGGAGRWYRVSKAGPEPNRKAKRKTEQNAETKREQKLWYRYVAEGCLVGFLIVAAVAAGVMVAHLPTTVVGTELGALVIATAGGFSGAPMLDKLKVVFPATR